MVSFGPDRRHLVFSSVDGTLRLWDTETFSQIGSPFKEHTDEVQYRADCALRCLPRVVSGALDKTTQIESHLERCLGSVHCVSFSSDGLRIVSGGVGKMFEC